MISKQSWQILGSTSIPGISWWMIDSTVRGPTTWQSKEYLETDVRLLVSFQHTRHKL